MDEEGIREVVFAAVAGLARVQVQLLKAQAAAYGRSGSPAMRDVPVRSAWLDAVAPGMSLSGVIAAVQLATAHLATMAVTDSPTDRRHACLLLQHVACGAATWSNPTSRMARALGVKLAPTPMAETNGASLHSLALPPLNSSTFRRRR